MIGSLFNTFVFQPIYNILVGLLDVLPWADVGVVIILLTLIIKLILSPLSIKAVKTQMATKRIDPDLKKIQKEYKDDRQTQALKIMELYKENNIKPFAGILILLIQIPVVLGLYWVILRGGLPEINTTLLYGFIPVPTHIDMVFLGVISVTSGSIILSLLTGLSQYFQMRLAMPEPPKKGDNPDDFKDQLMRGMSFQMRYIFPFFVAFISYTLSAAIALYWITSNVFQIGQEMYVRKFVRDKD